MEAPQPKGLAGEGWSTDNAAPVPAVDTGGAQADTDTPCFRGSPAGTRKTEPGPAP